MARAHVGRIARRLQGMLRGGGRGHERGERGGRVETHGSDAWHARDGGGGWPLEPRCVSDGAGSGAGLCHEGAVQRTPVDTLLSPG